MKSTLTNASKNPKLLDRLVLITLAALIVVVVGFGAYYYWDRYVHLGDESPVEKGAAHLEEMVRENPEDPDARVALAQYYLQSGAYEKSIEQTNQVLAAMPEHQGGLFLLGMAYAYSGLPAEATEPLSQFVAMREGGEFAGADTDLQAALYFLGDSYMKLNQPEEAIKKLTQALALNATDADAMYLLGRAYTTTGQHQQAVDQYLNAIRFVPNFAEAYQGMIESYEAQGQTSHVAYARGMDAFTQQDYQTARAHLESAVDDLPDFAPAYVGLGLTLEQLGQLNEAQTILEKALALEPGDYMANHALGRVQAASTNVEG